VIRKEVWIFWVDSVIPHLSIRTLEEKRREEKRRKEKRSEAFL
jgi:hypothetical protein